MSTTTSVCGEEEEVHAEKGVEISHSVKARAQRRKLGSAEVLRRR